VAPRASRDAIARGRGANRRSDLVTTDLTDSTTDTAAEELGPVDYMVVEFPAGAQNFTGEVAAELARLSETGTIRILDLLILHKDAEGMVDALEIDDTPAVDELRALETDIAEILASEDVAHLAEAMLPGSVAGVIVWENRWAAPFATAARNAGGQLIASGRIPIQAILASVEADAELDGFDSATKKEN
jgi:hypothetical protein